MSRYLFVVDGVLIEGDLISTQQAQTDDPNFWKFAEKGLDWDRPLVLMNAKVNGQSVPVAYVARHAAHVVAKLEP